DRADALHRHGAALERLAARHPLHRRLDALVGAERGDRRGIARAAERAADARHEVGLVAHPLHVTHRGADVFGRDVTPAEALHEAAVGAEELLGLHRLRVADDDGLTAAEVQAR